MSDAPKDQEQDTDAPCRMCQGVGFVAYYGPRGGGRVAEVRPCRMCAPALEEGEATGA